MMRGLLVCLSLVPLLLLAAAQRNRQGFAPPGLNPRQGVRQGIVRQIGGFASRSNRRQLGGFAGPSVRKQLGRFTEQSDPVSFGGFAGRSNLGSFGNFTEQPHIAQCTADRTSCSESQFRRRRLPSPMLCSSNGDCEYNGMQGVCCFEPCLQRPVCRLRGCVWNRATYKHGDINRETCLIMQCNNGAWEYADLNNNNCGRCTVEGDPHFLMFDQTSFLQAPYNKYEYGGKGNFVITQNGLSDSSFGVNAVFQTCNTVAGRDLSCVTSISYYEPGITVDVELPDQTSSFPPACTRSGHNPSTDPNCRFMVKVRVDGEAERQINYISVNVHHANVFIFTHNHIGGDANLFCMNVVGSQGLSVSLCQHERNFSWLYVLPMPTLRNNPSQLYGLCNTYTGRVQSDLTIASNGLKTMNTTMFADSWVVAR